MSPESFLEAFFAGDLSEETGCIRCRGGKEYRDALRMAFQPIVDCERREVFAWEALVRGADGRSAGEVLASLRPEQLYAFDQTCRVLAIATAHRLRMRERLSINFLPNAVYEPAACLRLTLAAARKVGFPIDRLVFEMTESEQIRDPAHALKIIKYYQAQGFLTAIDDFGAGYSGLNLLGEFQPQLIKLDMALVRNIHEDVRRQAIVSGVLQTSRLLDVEVVAEGVECAQEFSWLREQGIRLFQGYFFARPQIESLPDPQWP